MKLIYTLLIILTFHTISLSQTKPTKKDLVKLFKSSIYQPSKKSISVGLGAWTICNQDSAYFKADTIKLYNNINYFYQISTCCDFVNWTFYKKKAFIQSCSQICKEPASANIKTDYYVVRIISNNGNLLLQVIDKRNSKTFKVLSLKEIKLEGNNSTTEITLKRYSRYYSSL